MKCVFCLISEKQIPAKVFYEDSDVMGVVDINPRSTGCCIVFPKKHYFSPEEDLETSGKVFKIASLVAKTLKESLKPLFISIAFLPSQSKHFHLKILPYYEKEIPLFEKEPKKVKEEELDKIRKILEGKIKLPKKEIEQKIETPPKKEEKEKERTPEEIYWIKRNISIA